MSLYWLYWIASFFIVVGILAVGAAVQEWWLWRKHKSGLAEPPSQQQRDRREDQPEDEQAGRAHLS